MSGRGTTAVIDQTPTNLRQYSCFISSPNYKTLISGSDPLEMEEAVMTGLIGPGHSFAVQYMQNNPTRGVVLVPVAHGSTALCVAPADWAVGNTLHEFAVARTNEAITVAVALNSGSKFVGVVWLQGEQDNVIQSVYAAALDASIDDYRSRLTGATNSWFAVLGMLPEFIGGGSAGVNAAHIDTPNRKAHASFTAGPSGFVQADGLTKHYNAAGQRVLGPAAANSVIGL